MKYLRGVNQVLAMVLMMFVVSACAPEAPTPAPIGELVPPAGGEVDPGGETSPPVVAHMCNHPFFPAVEGAHWTYSGVESAAGPYSFTNTVTNLRASGFTLSGDHDGLVQTQEWSCSDAGLGALDYAGMGSARVSSSGMNFQLETTDMTGVTLPADLGPGSTWSQSFSVSGEMTLEGGIASTATGTASSHNVAIDFESVTVPAGTFDALRIERTIEIDLVVNTGGVALPVTVSSTESTWFALGVGWIRSSFTGTIVEQSVDESIELDAYSIP